MPSVTDLQQQSSKTSSNNHGKSTPPLQQQQQQSNLTTTDPTSTDPTIQTILMLEKKQRNLSKRKEKLESYDQEAKSGKELNKDQKEALAKYGEVLGQIECVKDLYEQMKKIQTDSVKNQKRLAKQAAEEKRVLAAQRLREYAQLRYLLDHRPSSLKPEESSLLDELARLVIPSDVSSTTVTRTVDTVLAIYQGGPLSSTVKNLTGRTSQEIRETLEQLIQQYQTNEISTPQFIDTLKQTPLIPQVPPTTPASVLTQQQSTNNDVLVPSLSHTHLLQTNPNEYPSQFDTRNPNISLQQIIQDNTFFPVDLNNPNNNQQDRTNNQENQTNDSKQYLPTFNAINTNLTGQTISSQQQQVNNYEQENVSNVVSSSHVDEQQSEEQWQQPRSNSGNANRSGNYNGSGNRNYNRGGAQNNYNQQHWRGQRGGSGHYDSSYGGGGQRQYNENSKRGGSNPNYRGNRGGNYRGGNRGNNTGYDANGYQRSSQYQQQNEQQVRSAPPNQQ